MTYSNPPRQAQPSFYETVVAETPSGNVVTHETITQITARPRWSFKEANERAMRAINKDRVTKVGGRPKAKSKPRPKPPAGKKIT